MDEIQILLGLRVKQLRKAKSLTQAQLAENLDLSDKYISQIERGIATPTFQTLYSLATALDVDLKTLFDFRATAELKNNIKQARKRFWLMVEQR